VQTDKHPVVNVNWEDAIAFCQWLSKSEDRAYRLPTDHEWSLAVGIGSREDPLESPSSKSDKIPEVYPWGVEWPPPKTAGNYGKLEGRKDDAFENTSPVGSFPANEYGLYDMGGNAWQWCEDWNHPEHKFRVLRGASWFTHSREMLPSSHRFADTATHRMYDYGFRVVIEP
jgi:formylglycine-generating enzyme required for sulfatase activity